MRLFLKAVEKHDYFISFKYEEYTVYISSIFYPQFIKPIPYKFYEFLGQAVLRTQEHKNLQHLVLRPFIQS